MRAEDDNCSLVMAWKLLLLSAHDNFVQKWLIKKLLHQIWINWVLLKKLLAFFNQQTCHNFTVNSQQSTTHRLHNAIYLFPLLSLLESDKEFCSLLELSFSRNESCWLLSDLMDLSSRTLCGMSSRFLCGILLGLGLEGYQNKTPERGLESK